MNYIVYINDIVKIEFDNLKDLFKSIYGSDYFDLNKKERFIKRFKLAKCQKILKKSEIPIADSRMGILDSENERK